MIHFGPQCHALWSPCLSLVHPVHSSLLVPPRLNSTVLNHLTTKSLVIMFDHGLSSCNCKKLLHFQTKRLFRIEKLKKTITQRQKIKIPLNFQVRLLFDLYKRDQIILKYYKNQRINCLQKYILYRGNWGPKCSFFTYIIIASKVI